MNNELGKMWKEVVMASKVLFQHLPGGTDEHKKKFIRKASLWFEI
jgi:hypothetical protein